MTEVIIKVHIQSEKNAELLALTEQLNMLWYLLSNIALRAQKTFPDSLVTLQSKKIRPILDLFSII